MSSNILCLIRILLVMSAPPFCVFFMHCKTLKALFDEKHITNTLHYYFLIGTEAYCAGWNVLEAH